MRHVPGSDTDDGGMTWTLVDAALVLGTFLLSLLPAVVYGLRRGRGGPGDAPVGRYCCRPPRDEPHRRG
jgi:hypothetical protein